MEFIQEQLRNRIRVELRDDDGVQVASGVVDKYPDAFGQDEKMPWIWSVWTEEDHRRKGYATMVVKKLLDIAREHGHKSVALIATDMGKPVYEKIGFRYVPCPYGGGSSSVMRLDL